MFDNTNEKTIIICDASYKNELLKNIKKLVNIYLYSILDDNLKELIVNEKTTI